MSGDFIKPSSLSFWIGCYQRLTAFFQGCARVLKNAMTTTTHFFSGPFRQERTRSRVPSFGTRVNFFSAGLSNQYQYAERASFSQVGLS